MLFHLKLFVKLILIVDTNKGISPWNVCVLLKGYSRNAALHFHKVRLQKRKGPLKLLWHNRILSW